MFHGTNILRGIFPVRGLATSMVIAGAIYATLKYFVPQTSTILVGLQEIAFGLLIIPLFIPMITGLAGICRLQKWTRNASLQRLRQMPFVDFRLLIAEALRREGYFVEEKTGLKNDHGIDLILHKENYLIVAICKYWQSCEIDSCQVQELYKNMLQVEADVAIFITTGTFTEKARRTARSKSLVLADGKALIDLVKPIQADSQFESMCYLRRASLEPIF